MWRYSAIIRQYNRFPHPVNNNILCKSRRYLQYYNMRQHYYLGCLNYPAQHICNYRRYITKLRKYRTILCNKRYKCYILYMACTFRLDRHIFFRFSFFPCRKCFGKYFCHSCQLMRERAGPELLIFRHCMIYKAISIMIIFNILLWIQCGSF